MARSGQPPLAYAGGMNPRYRRLVIPGALVGLILIVVLDRRAEGLTVAAEPLLRALTRMRGLLLDDQQPGPGGRVRPPEGPDAAAGAGSSSGTSTSRPAAASR